MVPFCSTIQFCGLVCILYVLGAFNLQNLEIFNILIPGRDQCQYNCTCVAVDMFKTIHCLLEQLLLLWISVIFPFLWFIPSSPDSISRGLRKLWLKHQTSEHCLIFRSKLFYEETILHPCKFKIKVFISVSNICENIKTLTVKNIRSVVSRLWIN